MLISWNKNKCGSIARQHRLLIYQIPLLASPNIFFFPHTFKQGTKPNHVQVCVLEQLLKQLQNLARLPEVLPSKLGTSTKFFFNSQNLIIFGKTLRAAWCTSFDLPCAQAHHQVSNEAILSLSRPAKYTNISLLLLVIYYFNSFKGISVNMQTISQSLPSG